MGCFAVWALCSYSKHALAIPSAGNTTQAIDAKLKGGVARFLNHSTEPNLVVQNVLVEHGDLRLPHIAFFALRDIPPLEELTFHPGPLSQQQESGHSLQCISQCLFQPYSRTRVHRTNVHNDGHSMITVARVLKHNSNECCPGLTTATRKASTARSGTRRHSWCERHTLQETAAQELSLHVTVRAHPIRDCAPVEKYTGAKGAPRVPVDNLNKIMIQSYVYE